MRNQHYFINLKPRLKLGRKLCIVAIILYCFSVATFAQEEDWMPDVNLREAVRQKLEIDTNTPLTEADMLELVALDTSRLQITGKISDLTGLEYAINLEVLLLPQNRIQDVRPLASLTKLTFLDLGGNAISDVSPLVGLVNLEVLGLWSNQIVDVSPLAGLVNLKDLSLTNNQIEDFSPLAGLVNLEVLTVIGNSTGDISVIPASKLKELGYDSVCDLPGVPIRERVENREYPSIFSAWENIINLPERSWNERIAYHDLRWNSLLFGLLWVPTPEGVKNFLHVESAKEGWDEMLALNPNMIFIVSMNYQAENPDKYPEDWPYWVRDEFGNRIKVDGEPFLIDITLPEVQDQIVQRAVAIAKCGLYDGILLDWWAEWLLDKPVHRYYANDVREGAVTLLRRIREGVDEVREDFLIIANTLRLKVPRSAPYLNGTFMETQPGYTHAELAEIESTLLWSEQNFRQPQINCLEGWGEKTEPLDSPRNQQWMRLFTTMSLTHSNGYVNLGTSLRANHTHLYEILPGHSETHAQGIRHEHVHQHFWYSFYDVPLGRPVGEKGQLYKNRKGVSIEGLFIREFTNGWAVYNRSGKERTIYLPEKVSAVESGVENKHWHTIPDVDGEIYLKEIIPPDTTRPEVSIAVSSDTQDSAFDAVITFTEPVSDFGQTDVSISGTATARITAWTISENNTTYIATITPTTSGTLILNVNENVAADDASNPNTPATQQTLSVQLIPAWDVNRDGQVNVLDLVAVANAFGKDAPDVNGDGVVNILDLVAVAQHFGDATTAAPSILAMNAMHSLDAATVQAWIARAHLENDGSIAFQEAIANLQRLLASLIPKETTLLANYPNPFNPETWIPYHLANLSHVTITIYDIRGSVVRQLNLGHQRQGYYTSRSRAAYWEGRNDVGERVASGVYFYTLTAGDFTATRKMLILK